MAICDRNTRRKTTAAIIFQDTSQASEHSLPQTHFNRQPPNVQELHGQARLE